MSGCGYVVTCEDGQVRHVEPFDKMPDARHWAEWGHCCTNRHTYKLVGFPRSVIVTVKS